MTILLKKNKKKYRYYLEASLFPKHKNVAKPVFYLSRAILKLLYHCFKKCISVHFATLIYLFSCKASRKPPEHKRSVGRKTRRFQVFLPTSLLSKTYTSKPERKIVGFRCLGNETRNSVVRMYQLACTRGKGPDIW